MNFLGAVYSHPEYYPPTLNAITELAGIADEGVVLGRNVKDTEWAYPHNVKLEVSGKFRTIREAQSAGEAWKILSFLTFTFKFYRLARKKRPELIICYDPIPLLSFFLLKPFLLHKPRLWYHNHDMIDIKGTRKYSISWWAARAERRRFSEIDMFSLPSDERKQFFNMQDLKAPYFLIPNYPAKKSDLKNVRKEHEKDKVRLIYQGQIGTGHGLEEFIDLVNIRPHLYLTITGLGGTPEYVSSLRNRASTDRVKVLDPVPLSELGPLTRKHDIGIAINMPLNDQYRTAALASNKIYEYAAAGLPIFYFDNEHHNNALAKYAWAFATDLTTNDLDAHIDHINSHLPALSEAAERDFLDKLNFEVAFRQVKEYIKQIFAI